MQSQSNPSASPSRKSRMRSWAGRLLRWTRTLGLLVILVVVVIGVFLNKVGLPGYVKKRLVEELRAEGWDVDFSRVRLRWRRGIVIENLHLQRANQFSGPHLFVNGAQCHLNHAAF